MPIGGKVRLKATLRAPPPKPAQETAPQHWHGVAHIKPPAGKPVRILVQPTPRPGVKQYTVLRYDQEGQYFVDEYVERLGLAAVTEDRRNIHYVTCPQFQFSVALVVCHRYCAFPCRIHLEAIQQGGWFKPGGFVK